jgi:hypothetical protein
MALAFVFLLGLANFALHKAVLESAHPLLGEMTWLFRPLGGKLSLAVEFVLLLAALLLVANVHPGWGWAYFGYSLGNAFAAWLILSKRV